MVYINMNICINIMQVQWIIYYVYNTVDTEPGIDTDKNSGELYNYVGNTVDTYPEDLYETYPWNLQSYEIMNFPKNENMQEGSYDKL